MQEVKKSKWVSISNSFEELVIKKVQEQMIKDIQKMENDFWNLIPEINARDNNK